MARRGITQSEPEYLEETHMTDMSRTQAVTHTLLLCPE